MKTTQKPKQSDVTYAVNGLIRAQDPCDYPAFLDECRTQVISFENLNEMEETIFIDQALNELLWQNKIMVDTSWDKRIEYPACKYTVCFRPA